MAKRTGRPLPATAPESFAPHAGWLPAPWDLTEIEVRSSPSALAIFDHETVGDADEVMADLATAAKVVKTHVPHWSGRFVAYDISDVQAIDELSTMDVDQTAGVAFAVLNNRDRVAAYRFIVNPRHAPVRV